MSITIYKASKKEITFHAQHYNAKAVAEFIGDATDVIKVSADGHELTDIINSFSLPMLKRDSSLFRHLEARGYVMNWHGDHAKFIADNLFLIQRT